MTLRIIKMAFRQEMAVFLLENSSDFGEHWDENLMSDIAKVIDYENLD
jgi:hypothetical protein